MGSDVKFEANIVLTKLRLNSPKAFVVAGSGEAQDTANKVAKRVADASLDYEPSQAVQNGPEWLCVFTPKALKLGSVELKPDRRSAPAKKAKARSGPRRSRR